MLIREAGDEDLRVVTSLRLRFLAAHRGVHHDSFSVDFEIETFRFFERHHEADSVRSWLAEVDGLLVGGVSLLILDLAPRPEDPSGREGYIINMFVDPVHRRHGIGAALLDRCLAASNNLSLRRLLLHTTDDGRGLYEKAGFAPNPKWMELPQ